MSYQQHSSTHYAYNEWMPMYEQNIAKTDGVYKPTSTTQTLEVEGESIPAHRKQTFMQKHLGGLKRTLRFFTVVGCVILAINVGWLGYAKSKYGIVDGYGTIETADCDSVKRTNTWFHLAINVLSTLLLTGSSAFMAAYSAPTRQEIDQAHARRRWLHVGCVSLRNMRGISWAKSLVVIVLALSSIPFHLLYNSLIFTSLSANNYYWAVATEDFTSGAAFNLTGPMQYTPEIGGFLTLNASTPDDESTGLWAWSTKYPNMTLIDMTTDYFRDMQTSAPNWERLDQKACIQAYANVFVSKRRNVILVSSTKSDTNSIVRYGSSDFDTELDNNWWICSEEGQDGGHMTCNPQNYIAHATSWQVFGNPIDYCLSEKVDDTCDLKFSMEIMIVVVAFNVVKVVAMIWILIRLDAQKLLACVGDAAASFIKQPDYTTLGICLAGRRDIDRYWRNPTPSIYSGATRPHWGRAISKKRWIIFFLVMITAWLAVFIFSILAFGHTRDSGVALTPAGLWAMGFGTINQFTMAISGGGGNALTNSLLANIPQVVLALIYLNYMGIMTTMFTAVDWSKFGTRGQTLMVSTPTGTQRGTWLFGAPLAYGIGLLTLQTLLHWFVSQSLFLVQMTVHNKLGQTSSSYRLVSNIGYSPIAIICAVVASGILVLSAIVCMLWRLPRGSPPVASTCSAAISAACHVPVHMASDALVFEKLRWGATDMAPNGVGHCSLGAADEWDAGHAGAPNPGWPYAGIWERMER